jgi:hypothetical protein
MCTQTANELRLNPQEDDLPTDPLVAAYEAHLTRLERELPGLERELARIRQSAGKAPAGCGRRLERTSADRHVP